MVQETPRYVSEGLADMEYAMKIFTLVPTPTNFDAAVTQLIKYQERWIADKASVKT